MAKEKTTAVKKAAKSSTGGDKAGNSSRKPSPPQRTAKASKKVQPKGKAASGKRPAESVKVKSIAKPAATKPVPAAKAAAGKSAITKTNAAKPVVKTSGKVASKTQAASKPAPKAPAVSTTPKVSASTTSQTAAKPQSASRPSGFKPLPKPPIKPAPPPYQERPVAGVLQAARSVASRANKVVEVQKERRSHLTAEELNEFRDVLLAKRRELVEDMVNLESEATRTGSDGGSASSTMPIHMADLGTDTWEQEFTLNLIEKERMIVREIDEALGRIESNTYGTCLATGKAIAKARLRVKPWAKYCIEYARKHEQGLS